MARGAARTLYAQYDAVEEIRQQAEKDLVKEAHKHPIRRVLETCPGLGAIRAAQMMPIVVSPGRFRTKCQFWSYCGLGIVMRSSSDWVPKKEGGGWTRARVIDARRLRRSWPRMSMKRSRKATSCRSSRADRTGSVMCVDLVAG
jgi:hypothetical protein